MEGLHLQLGHQFVVGFGVFTLQILHEAAALADLLDQTAAGGKVLLVRLQVVAQILDFFGQDCDLDLGRTRVRGVRLEFFNDALLFIRREHVIAGDWQSRMIRSDRAGWSVSGYARFPVKTGKA